MKQNKKGFTLIELLAVIVILAVIALIASPIILGIINDAREASRVRSVESYVDAVETTVTTYMTLNPDLQATSSLICSSACNTDCLIDGTKAGRDAGTPTCDNAKKAVTYSGSAVVCDSVTYDQTNGIVSVSGCKVGNDTEHSYKGDTKNGFELETSVDGD